jgi:hypothetical protein
VIEDDARPGFLYGPLIHRVLDIALSRLDDWDVLSLAPSYAGMPHTLRRSSIAYECVDAANVGGDGCVLLQTSTLFSMAFVLYNLRRRGSDILETISYIGEGYHAVYDLAAVDVILSLLNDLEVWVAPLVYQAPSFSDVANGVKNYLVLFQTAQLDMLAMRSRLLQREALMDRLSKSETCRKAASSDASAEATDRPSELACAYLGNVSARIFETVLGHSLNTYRCERKSFGPALTGVFSNSLLTDEYLPLIVNDNHFWIVAGILNVHNVRGLILVPDTALPLLPLVQRISLRSRHTAPLTDMAAISPSVLGALSFLSMLHDSNGWTIELQSWAGDRIGSWTGSGPYLDPLLQQDPPDIEYAAIPVMYPSCMEDALTGFRDEENHLRSSLFSASVIHFLSLDSRCWDSSLVRGSAANVYLNASAGHFDRDDMLALSCELTRSVFTLQFDSMNGEAINLPWYLHHLAHAMRERGYCLFRPADLAGIVFAKIGWSGYQ